MKNIIKYTLASLLAVSVTACEDLDELNESPNNPRVVPSHMVMSGAEKFAVDYVYDVWFSGRQCLTYAQQIGQRNYTEEDRYKIRETTNNSYFKYLYMAIGSFQDVINLNSNPETAGVNAVYGANQNQIAAARIMKAWLYDIITDTWGDVPYSEAIKLESEDKVYAKYDSQKDIYADLIKELTEAANQIDETKEAFVGGDIIFGGDASKWKKFANSLKCRLAIHLSKVDPKWKQYIAEALESGVMESNADAAYFKYSSTGSEYSKFYSGFFVDKRNDLTIVKPFTDLLNGVADVANNKTHPWEGVVDPRIKIFTTPASDGSYNGVAFAAPSGLQASFAKLAPNWYSKPPYILRKDFSVPLMTFAELQFILCEYNNYDPEYYKAGIKASIDYWSSLSGVAVAEEEVDAYITAVSANVNAESCSIQKYIDLYGNGTEAWTEIRRTGYPEQLIRPGEIVGELKGEIVRFSPINDVKNDIVSRVPYPTVESTINGAAFSDAISRLEDGTNNYYSKMYWDKRTEPYVHPENL